MRQIYPVTGPEIDVVPAVTPGPLPQAVFQLAALFGTTRPRYPGGGPRGVLRANMVASADGAASLDGRSDGLSGPADKMLFKVLRSLADVVLVGAGTAREEHYRPVQPDGVWAGLRPAGAPLPAVAVVSSSLDFAGCERLLDVPPGPAQTIVVTCASAPARRKQEVAARARVLEAGDQEVDLAAAVGALRDLGYESILTEGGPTLLGQLAAARLLDELCLTTSPLLALNAARRVVTLPAAAQAGAAPTRLSLAHVLVEGDLLACRYVLHQEVPLDD